MSFSSLLLALSRNRRTTDNKQFVWKTRERLFAISYQYMGWPAKLNSFIYPDIFDWDEDNNGRYTIPSVIAFYRNHYIPPNIQLAFKRHLNYFIPGPWDLDWSNASFVMAIRRPIRVQFEIAPGDITFRQLSTAEYEELYHGVSAAGTGHELERREDS